MFGADYPLGSGAGFRSFSGPTMEAMRAWNFSAGRWFGVYVRMHAFWLALLGLAVGSATYAGVAVARGMLLWCLMLGAVAVREMARALVTLWEGLELKGVLVLPTGAVLSYATTDASERAAKEALQLRLALAGPAANLLFGLVLAGLMLTVTPGIELWAHPWVTPTRLLRSAVWVNLLLAGVNLLPAAPLDGGRIVRGMLARSKGLMQGARASAGIGQAVGFLLVAVGVAGRNPWTLGLGVLVVFGPHLESDSMLLDSDVDAVTMRDVMLRNFSTISASETLEGALESAVHSLQDVFPVVRGGNMVGAVSRQGIVAALRATGDGYVQGVMTRTLSTASPDDSLVKTVRRMMSATGVQMVPVVEGERVVGIITPQNLAHSMRMLNQRRRLRRPADGRE